MSDNSTSQTQIRTQVISSIYFYTVMFTFSLIAFISGLSLIMSAVLKEPSSPSPSFSFLSTNSIYDTEKDLEAFKKDCKSDSSYDSFSSSSSSNTSYEYDYNATPADIEKKAAEKKALADAEKIKKDAEIEACAATRLTKQAEAKKKAEENTKKTQEENKTKNITISITMLTASIVVIILHLVSFRVLRKLFAQ